MADNKVKLILTADNSQYVQKAKQVMDVNQKMHDASVKGAKTEINVLNALENSLKNIKARKDAAFDPREIDKWDKKLLQAQKDLEFYNETQKKTGDQAKKTGEETSKATDKAEKSSGSLLSSLGKLAAGYLTISTAVKGFKFIIESTNTLSDKFKATLNGWKEGFVSMARAIANNNFKDFFKNVKEAVAEGQRFAETEEKIEDAQRALEMRIARNETKIKELRVEQNNALLSNTERLAKGLESEKLLKEDAADRLKLSEMILDNDMKNAAFKAGYREEEIKTGKIIIQQYLDQDAALLKNIEIGKEYNKQKQILNGIIAASGSTENPLSSKMADQLSKDKKATEEKIRLLGSEAEAYGILAVGLGSITDIQRDKIKQDNIEIETAKKSAIDLRVMSRNDALEVASIKDITDTKKEEADKQVKIQEDLKQSILKLVEDVDKTEIESLEGVDKLKAQRDFTLKFLAGEKARIEALGGASPELDIAFEKLGKFAELAFLKGMKGIADAEKEKTWQFNLDIGKKQFESIDKEAEAMWERIQKGGEDAWDVVMGKPTPKKEEEFSLWQLIGINPNSTDEKEKKEAERQIELIQQSVDQVKTILDDMYAKRVEDTQRKRELLDTEISEAQSALESEIELYKAGYASNVALKKKEVEDLKKQRQQALLDEQKAVKAQRTFDTIMQASSLITAAANIFKALTKALGPAGIPLAIIATGLMIGAFVAAKVKINEAAKESKGFYKGGWTGEGKERDSSGERVAGIVHEKEFVIKKGPALRFREVLEAINRDDKKMIFNSFNKLSPELYKGTTINNVVVENEGPNKRLDQVNNQLKQLNKKGKEESIIELTNKTIYRKGNLMRTVRR